jgi:hypothetical protein
MVRLLLILWTAVVPVDNWVIIIPGEEVSRQEISRWVEVLRISERVVDDFFHDALLGVSEDVLRVRVAPSSGDFAAWTGCCIWQGAAIKDGELIVQPLEVLERRGVTEEVIVHECVHLALEPYKVPLWLNEGLAVICSGQVRRLSRDIDLKDLPKDKKKIEELLHSKDTLDLRRGYLSAAVLTQETIDRIGLDSLILTITEEAL